LDTVEREKNAAIGRETVLRWWLEIFTKIAEFRLLETSGVVFTVGGASSMLCQHGGRSQGT
jgi:hypothetical protein